MIHISGFVRERYVCFCMCYYVLVTKIKRYAYVYDISIELMWAWIPGRKRFVKLRIEIMYGKGLDYSK